MKPITPEELLKNNRFAKWKKIKSVNPNSPIKFQTVFRMITPTREEAEKMQLRTLCLFIAVQGLRIRDAYGCANNANHWATKGKQAILDNFFPTVKDTSLNSWF